MATAANPSYVYADLLPPGIVAQRATIDALSAAYAANGYVALTQAQILAITGPSPAYPTGLPRVPDSNPEPRDGWTSTGATDAT